METKYLHYFLQVCKDKNLSEAAKKLYISQQALSSIIRKLEDSLNVSLFVRTKSGMLLTKYGMCLKDQATEMVRLMDETYQKLDTLRNDNQDNLHIGVSFGVMSALPPHFISDFKNRYPNIKLCFTEYPDTLCEQAVLDDHEQIGFSIAPIDHELFQEYTIIRDWMCVLAHRKNKFYHRKTVSLSELINEEFLLLNKNFKLRRTFEDQCRKTGFTPRCILETMELILIHTFSGLNRGMGVSVDFISKDIKNVRPIRLDPDCSWEVCAIARKGKRHSDATRCFLRYIEQVACYYPGMASLSTS